MKKILGIVTALFPCVTFAQVSQGVYSGINPVWWYIIFSMLFAATILLSLFLLGKKYPFFKKVYWGLLFLVSLGILGYLFIIFANARTYYTGSVVVKSGDLLLANEHGANLQAGAFGPRGFNITDNKLFASKDIPGLPSKRKYKEAVRRDISNTNIQIDENSWEIDTKYPWIAVY